jgi:hypothetical protein
MASATTLSTNDSRILAALFDPETLPSSVAKTRDASLISATLPPLPSLSAAALAPLEAAQNSLIARATAATTSTSTSTSTSSSTAPPSPEILAAAIAELDDVVARNPAYPSARVNRAMLRRLALEAAAAKNEGESESIFSFHPASALAPLFDDLTAAIALCLPSPSATATPTPTPTPVSAYAARILRSALSHRAYLYLKAAEAQVPWDGAQGAELEERASVDFAGAARYGDAVAREMSVRTNPYARACGGIVREALRGERGE